MIGRKCVSAMSVMDVVSGRSGGELGHVQRTERNRASLVQPGKHGRGGRAFPVLSYQRASRGYFIGRIKHILVSERNAVQRAANTSGSDFPVALSGNHDRSLSI